MFYGRFLSHVRSLLSMVRCTTQSAVISSAASLAGVADAAGEEAKDYQYLDIINKSGGGFISLVCESFGVWTPYALSTLLFQ